MNSESKIQNSIYIKYNFVHFKVWQYYYKKNSFKKVLNSPTFIRNFEEKRSVLRTLRYIVVEKYFCLILLANLASSNCSKSPNP
jgi:hypothetical protein